MGISEAIAQTVPTPATASGTEVPSSTATPPANDPMGAVISLLPIVLIFMVFYFLVLRPQQKAAKEHQKTLDSLRRGDKVITAGGLIATVVRIQDEEITLEIAEGVKVRAVKSTIARVNAKIGSSDKAGADDEDKNDDSSGKSSVKSLAKK